MERADESARTARNSFVIAAHANFAVRGAGTPLDNGDRASAGVRAGARCATLAACCHFTDGTSIRPDAGAELSGLDETGYQKQGVSAPLARCEAGGTSPRG